MRKDYALLDQKIKAAYISCIEETKQIPTEMHIAEICGTTQATVSKHLNAIDLSELISPFKIFGNDVLLGLRDRAYKGDAQAAKLFFMLVYDWTEKTEKKIEGTIEHIIKVVYDDEDDRI